MKVVTSAISTSELNRAWEITPWSSARLRTISSVRPRVFISVAEHRRLAPVEAGDAGGEHRAAELAGDRHHAEDSCEQDQLRADEGEDVGAQPGEDEEEGQQDGDDEVLDPVGDVLGEAGVAGHDQAGRRNRRRSAPMPIDSVV